MYTSKGSGPVPSWAQSPTRSQITAEQWASVTNQKQSEPKMTTDIYGNPIQSIPKPERTTDLYGNPLPPVASQRHRSTVAPSSLDPRNCSQTKTALYAEIVKDASNGESSGNNDSSEHDSSSDEDVSTSVEDDTTSSSSEDGSECESSREVINSDAERPTSESDSSKVCVDEPTAVNCDNCARLSVKCVDSEANMSELQGKHDALKANLFDLQNKHVDLDAKWCDLQSKHEALQNKYDVTFIHNEKLTVESSSGSCESMNLLYTLIGSDKIYSDNDFPINNVNHSLIDKVFEDSTNKFLGKSSPRVVVTQCAPIPKSEVRKKYGNQKLQKQNNQRKQNHAAQGNGKGKQSQNKKKVRKINFVRSRGTDKIETFENKSNTDFVKQSKILKRNSQNNYTQHTNGCDVGPSTSISRSSSSSSYSYDTPRFVERRSCFECCEYGHIIKNCPYLTKGKSKVEPPMVTITIKDLFHQKRTLVLLNNGK
ncbi:putative transcription factor interactor and regulator CCHC(Zn) family [Helianthus annuus]|uniref:Transcription factor interactor and regulator CCHC(Zn) family n=1 Tax=Helianthus annuus TaxID=4232 RepID=A0A9K3JLC5_HELAN|nr:uncharacterized protein LOC118483868 [Helianthus annuus]KAF5817231.1 putative transcription factor interactor and regulator CCHC(Zn) family [Helianthus annuus]KAJ0950582.1 putative transcription factor interactor and regulator CCHC(Zn) family [Helianthus annuus]